MKFMLVFSENILLTDDSSVPQGYTVSPLPLNKSSFLLEHPNLLHSIHLHYNKYKVTLTRLNRKKNS